MFICILVVDVQMISTLHLTLDHWGLLELTALGAESSEILVECALLG